MPTGYTAGILDGTTKNFKQFAMLCTRAFGACIHMREEDLDKPYEPRTVGEYYVKSLNEARERLKKVMESSDAELIKEETDGILESKRYYIERIEKIKEQRKTLLQMLVEAEKWVAPTKEHVKFKEYMINQINMTIDHDGNTTYYEKELVNLENRLTNIDVKKLREHLIESAEESLQYSIKNYDEELKRVESSNKWMEDIINSLSHQNYG